MNEQDRQKQEKQEDVVAQKNGQVPVQAQKIKSCTDLGNAERLVDRFGHQIRYCPDKRSWYVFRQGRWMVDNNGMMARMAFNVVRSIDEEAKEPRIKAVQKKELLKHAKQSASKGRLQAMIDLARSFPNITVPIWQFDRNVWSINCKNGTLDLRTGDLNPHNPDDLITKMLPFNYDPAALCPVWEATIEKIMGGDAEKVEFIKRVLGYAMTGVTGEQCLFIFYGSGANGKSTILEIYRELLAGYAMHTTTATLIGSSSALIRNDLARLNGARFVSAVEIGMGKRLDEALVKQLTGGDQVTARFLYNEFFEYKPEFKLFIAANHKPEIQGVDHGIWRRIHLIPFEVTIPVEEIDRNLPEKLRDELPGILAWAVKGCHAWQRQGLSVPASISNATAAYRAEMDIVDEFLNDRCEFRSGGKIALGALYDEYKDWAGKACQDAVGKKIFGNLMRQKAHTQSKSGGVRYWNGIQLAADQ